MVARTVNALGTFPNELPSPMSILRPLCAIARGHVLATRENGRERVMLPSETGHAVAGA